MSHNIQEQIGYSSEAILQNAVLMYDAVLDKYKQMLIGKETISRQTLSPFSAEFQFKTATGEIKWLELKSTPSKQEDGSIIYDGIQTDISLQKENEKRLLKINRELELLNKFNDKILTITQEQALLDAVCKCLVKEGGYVLTWISKKPIESNPNQIIQSLAQYGRIDYLEEIKIDLNNQSHRNGPTASVLLSRKETITNNFAFSKGTKPWHLNAQKYNIAASLVLPLDFPNAYPGVINIYSSHIDAFDEHEVEVLKRISQNLSLAIQNIFNRDEKEKSTYLLKERMKELKTMYLVSQALQDENLNTATRLNQLVNLLPSGWQFVNDCTARIVFNNIEFTTTGFNNTVAVQKAEINCSKGLVGSIEVGYTKKFPKEYDGPFLKEEVELLNALAKMIGDYYDRKITREELHQSSANLATIFKHTDIGYILLDNHYNVISFNDAMQKGYVNQMGVNIKTGINFLDTLIPERKKIKQRAFDKAITNKESIYYEIFHERNGIGKFYSINVNPIIDDTGVLGICLSAYDITVRKTMELESQKITNDLVQRNRDLEQFSYIVSHNIRAPLANIIGLNSLLNENISEADKKEVISSIALSVEILDNVVKDVSKILQIRNEISEKKETVSFNDIVISIEQSIKNIIDENEVSIKTNFVETDNYFTIKTYLVSIFQNLITNAIKYSKPYETPVIKIWSKQQKNKILLHFKDNGLGMDLDKCRHQLFGLYKRFHFHVEGKGLGLFLTKTHVNAIGGEIQVQSELGVGTEFIITLPVE
jgi:PAS domain S-box-containing protein